MTTPPEHPAPISAFLPGARAALAFLTRIPCGMSPVTPAALAWAPAWFPVVGLLLGAAGGAVLLGLFRAGSLVSAVAAVTFLAFITGGFHEDGLADTADAMGGAYDRPKLFAILKDSRIGSFGATALILILFLRISALSQLGAGAAVALMLSQTLSRTTPIWLMAFLPYATAADTSRSAATFGRGPACAFIATVFAGVATTGLLMFSPLALPLRPVCIAVAVAAVLTLACGWRFHVRAGGLTGDFLGATQQLTDAAVLLTLAASL